MRRKKESHTFFQKMSTSKIKQCPPGAFTVINEWQLHFQYSVQRVQMFPIKSVMMQPN